MKWLVLWFTLSGQQINGLPEKTFDTEAACTEFANSRVGMVWLMAGEKPRFECRVYPFVEPKT